MRSLASALIALVFILGPAAGAEGHRERIPWLTFNEVTLTGKRHVLSAHDVAPAASALSPDSRRFAYVSYTCDGCPRSPSLRVADVRSARDKLLFEAADGIYEVAWAPNGQSIAFVSDGIWLIGADGTNPRRVAEPGVAISWSPDSMQIAYMDARGDHW